MKILHLPIRLAGALLWLSAHAGELSVTDAPGPGDWLLADGPTAPVLVVEAAEAGAVRRAAGDLADDFARVTGTKPEIKAEFSGGKIPGVIIGTMGKSKVVDRLAAERKLDTNGLRGQWESYVLQMVTNPVPGVDQALVIAGSDRRGTIYGIYQLSEMIGVSPWYWWADVPVTQRKALALRGQTLRQGPPAVKYRGIFLNDEDWGLRPWAAKTFDPETKNIGPKTYAKVFELLLRLRANYLWPAMHAGTAAFNSFPENRALADAYGIVMGSSHCEQMLRNNVSEWDAKTRGDYNFVTNPDGVLSYWEQRLRENGKFENIYTVGMRGIHDSGMPGGGSELEQAARLHTIIVGQREMLARLVNPALARVPQIFCPYKEVLGLYRLRPDLPDDVTIVWPDDNFGYIREFSDARERARSGGAGVYYHVSYYGAPQDYLWLCSTPPALIAEEMTKAYEHGANRVWVLNVGDLKPAELDLEFFLRLAWQPQAWNGTNTYDLLGRQLRRDFGPDHAPQLASLLAEYYRLNFQRKPEHLAFPTNDLFSGSEAAQRLTAWKNLAARADAVATNLPPAWHDALFELVGYPIGAAAAANERALSPATAQRAQDEIHRLTDRYNRQLAGGKWQFIMSANPRGQLERPLPGPPPPELAPGDSDLTRPAASAPGLTAANFPGVDFAEDHRRVVIEAEHASAMIPGQDSAWRTITGLGYNGNAVAVFPTSVPVRSEPRRILAESPCLQYRVWLLEAGDWKVTVRTLPTFSVEPGQPQRYAIAFDEAAPQIVALPASLDENDRTWQTNVLRNAALTTSVHSLAQAGRHTLKIWMVDPGLVIDTVAAQTGPDQDWEYVWPAETCVVRSKP